MSRAAYQDPGRDLDERVQDLLGRMTLAEKLRQLGGILSSSLVREDRFDAEQAEALLAQGIGHITRVGANTGLTPQESAGFANAVQRVLLEKSRLGIPALIHEEAVAGFCTRGATQFPQAIGLAATFAPRMVRRMAETIRASMCAVGARQALAPVLDISRDARWGRLEETYGEDPYLAGRMGVAYVRGLQGDDLTRGVAATGKHFLGSGLPEGGVNRAPVQLGPRQLREVFAEPFAAAIREAGLKSVMNSSSSVDGVPCGGAAEILEELLRNELGFRGLVVADYFTVDLLIRHHRVAADKGAAAALALTAGLDVELPALDCYGDPLEAKVNDGAVDIEVVDRAVARVLRLKFELGLFESPYVDEASAGAQFDTPEQRQLGRELAEQSMVLLKNTGVLPLKPGTHVALIGPTADDQRLLLGDYHYPGPYFVPMVTPRAGLAAVTRVTYAAGCGISGADQTGFAAAVAAVGQADVAVVCVGGKSGLLADCTSGESRDTADLTLTGPQQALLAAVAAVGKPLVVVVIGGRAFDLSAVDELADALLLAWLPGEEAGNALARVLFGEVSPAGRLPVSLPRHVGQVPVYYNHRSGGGRGMIPGDYTDLSTRPLYCFGHGLAYAGFDYSELICPDSVDVYGTINVIVTVTNTGAVLADEVVQLYLHDKVADVARPVQQLVGFERLTLAPGGSATLRLLVDATQLAYYDRDMAFVVDPGEIEVMVGASCQDIRRRATVRLQGERRFLKRQQMVATQIQVDEHD